MTLIKRSDFWRVFDEPFAEDIRLRLEGSGRTLIEVKMSKSLAGVLGKKLVHYSNDTDIIQGLSNALDEKIAENDQLKRENESMKTLLGRLSSTFRDPVISDFLEKVVAQK